jgi:hypothetical protein
VGDSFETKVKVLEPINGRLLVCVEEVMTTPTPTSTGPVNIDGTTAWSGPTEMAGALSDVWI